MSIGRGVLEISGGTIISAKRQSRIEGVKTNRRILCDEESSQPAASSFLEKAVSSSTARRVASIAFALMELFGRDQALAPQFFYLLRRFFRLLL